MRCSRWSTQTSPRSWPGLPSLLRSWPPLELHTGATGGAFAIRRLHAEKPGLRCLGVAESFERTASSSTLAGVVMRRDGVIDGAVLGRSTISGNDATDAIAAMHGRLGRHDISCTIVSGLVISMYNIVNIERLAEMTGAPAIGVTYRESGGLEEPMRLHFESPEARLAEYASMPPRERVALHTGHDVHIWRAGCSADEARAVLNSFTVHGALPEPLRVARILARAARTY